MIKKELNRVLLFGDDVGINQLLHYMPKNKVAGLVAAFNRPGALEFIQNLAKEHDLPLLIQPPRNDQAAFEGFFRELTTWEGDGLIANSYSLLVPEEILGMVEGAAFNIHYALLPRNRGVNPVEWAIANGDETTGVSLHVMSNRFDEGDLVAQIEDPILPDDTWVSLVMRLYGKSMTLIEMTLPKLLTGDWDARAQNETAATYNAAIPKEGMEIDFKTMSDDRIYNIIRANVDPHQGAFIRVGNGKTYIRDFIARDYISRLRETYERTGNILKKSM